MTFGYGPEGTETHRRTEALTTGAVGEELRAEDGTALVVQHQDNRTPVRKVTGATDKSERVAGLQSKI